VKTEKLRNFFRSLPRAIGLLAVAAGILILVSFSPVALKQVAKVPGMNWVLLSNIGQTYGAVSALLSALALGGVVISLLYQARDLRIASEQAARTFHSDLLRMEMDDPFYMEIMAATGIPGEGPFDFDSLRRRQFIHLWVSHWESQYKLGEMTDDNVRYTASAELFNSSEGRRYWSGVRDLKLKKYRGRLARFAKIVNEEYNRAIATGPPPVAVPLKKSSSMMPSDESRRMLDMRSVILVCAAAGSAVIAGHLLGQRLFRRP
jgi:hypothetical protein